MEWKLKRIKKAIKQKEIAKQLNVSAALISYYENNKSSMCNHLIDQYQNIINMDQGKSNI
ncbi:helix-turn-helix transcriptional regulator [Paenibacillus sp. KACC 21273]|uniref:helix-turn-helix domain-containing protein n=1 Tax=Paenibacillus sp. KACC 21273 TaxID=3025665 RepID=UPI0023656834|nr:helix-turn-helix transcriptional regulator [Paenibacillus sp. KACC 21273]WDF52317.1 helix-turn-helix transcriptional regulator [Paenibacillus sp. KACC 21273]